MAGQPLPHCPLAAACRLACGGVEWRKLLKNDRAPELARQCARITPPIHRLVSYPRQIQLFRSRSLRTLRISRRANKAALPPCIGTGAVSRVSVESRAYGRC